MRLPPAPLEEWLRNYYFEAAIDISSSGVEPYSMAELGRLVGVVEEDFQAVVFRDSPSLGDVRLREGIALRWGDGDPSHVLAAGGSSEALFLVLTAMLGEGDQVVVQDPAYHSLDAIATAAGCSLRRWPLRPENGFHPDLDELETVVSAGTRMLVINAPHNPTGTSLSVPDFERLIDMTSRVGAWLVWDAAFQELTFDGPPLPNPALSYDRAISFGTLSKAYGLPGLRVGWAIGPPATLDLAVRVRDYTSLALSPLVEVVAIRAVEGADALLIPRLQQARRNLAVVEEWMAAHAGTVRWFRPDAGVVAFPRLLDVGDVVAFCHRLMAEAGVLLVPGGCFGHPTHVRLGFGGPTADLVKGLDRLSAALDRR